MTISSFQAAKIVCSLGEGIITNLKLQKILYLCHLFYLGETNTPLIDEEFEAWYYGPVLPSVYEKMKLFGNRPIRDIFHNVSLDENAPETFFIQEKFREISNKSAWDLVLMTHLKGGAWEKHFDNCDINVKIPTADIIHEYMKFYA